MLEFLGKSVVITGSQIPLFESRSDGRDNFLGALILAGLYVIPEVTVYFGHKLFRGNRITKVRIEKLFWNWAIILKLSNFKQFWYQVSCDSLNGFDSPNFGPLATMGISIRGELPEIETSKLEILHLPPKPFVWVIAHQMCQWKCVNSKCVNSQICHYSNVSIPIMSIQNLSTINSVNPKIRPCKIFNS